MLRVTSEDEIDPNSRSYSSVSTTDPIDWNCYVEAGGTARFDLP